MAGSCGENAQVFLLFAVFVVACRDQQCLWRTSALGEVESDWLLDVMLVSMTWVIGKERGLTVWKSRLQIVE